MRGHGRPQVPAGPAVAGERSPHHRRVGPAHPRNGLDDDRACAGQADGRPAARPAGMAASASTGKARWRWVDHETDEPVDPEVRLRLARS